MSDPITLNSASVSAPPAPATPPGDELVALTKGQLDAMLRSAVQAGQGMAVAAAAIIPPAEVPEDWSLNFLFRRILTGPLHTEREQRSAYAAVDKYFPAEDN